MHLRVILVLFLTSTLLQSCFIADEFFTKEVKEPVKLDLQTTAEKNIRQKIQSTLKDETYTPYGFSELTIIKPLEIQNLESLEARLRQNKGDTILIRKIEENKTYIKENKIERMAELDHFFTIISNEETIDVMEIKYILNDTLAVKTMSPKIILSVPVSYQLILEYYFNEHTIIIAQTYAEGKRLSKTFYRFFKDQLETFETVEDKSNFLEHTLAICKLVKLKGNFDQDFIVQTLLKLYMGEEREDIEEYEPLKFSELYETKNNKDNSVVGYYFFHKFIGKFDNQKDTNVVLVEFSPYYEVDQIFQLEGSFESYTNPTK